MPRIKSAKTDDGIIRYEPKCKVCNSQFKTLIESLYDNNLNGRQILEALHSLKDQQSQIILSKEQLSEASINRHLEHHYSQKAKAALKTATHTDKLSQSRETFKNGIQTKVNTISTLSHLIDIALINMESLDSLPDVRQKHQLTINYMSQIKGLIDEFSKLTGELQIENTFDINFWNVQITEFANIVIQTIRKMDYQFQLNNKLEYAFGVEFQKQWKQYKETQDKILNGELPVNYGAKERTLNTFNIMPNYKQENNNEQEIDLLAEPVVSNNSASSANNEQEIDNHYLSGDQDFTEKDDKYDNLHNQFSEQEYNETIINQQLENLKLADQFTDSSEGLILSTDNFSNQLDNVDNINQISTDLNQQEKQNQEKLTRIAIVKQLLKQQQSNNNQSPSSKPSTVLSRDELLKKVKK